MEFKGTNETWEFRKWEGQEWPEKRWSVGVKRLNGKAVCISPRYDFETEESEANGKLIAYSTTMMNDIIDLKWLVDNGAIKSELVERIEATYNELKKAVE